MCLRRPDAERSPIAGAQLRFYFSPLSPEQEPDNSFRIGADRKFLRQRRSRSCTYCQGENPSREERDAVLSEHEATPRRRDGNAGQQREMDVIPHIEEEYTSFSTGSDETWARIVSWLELCHRNHPDCPKPGDSDADAMAYPTRMLDLSPVEDARGPLKLVTSANARPQGPYMTLSHCWGHHPILSLTSDNIAAFHEGVEFKKLSKTFQDAVVITRRLGVRYLWIDSLCIIQAGPDKDRDWLNEAGTMHRVYANSFLNIGATGAKDGRDGCFRERDYGALLRPIIAKPECYVHSELYRPKYRLVEEGFLDDAFFSEPLLQRGWVFQERFLAPRMLHFGSRQVFWECHDLRACESFPTGLLPRLNQISLATLRDHGNQPQNEDAMTRVLGNYHWYRIVSEYTSKQLTKENDKLAALSGVTRHFQQLKLPGIQCSAGIWESDLPRALCWKVGDGGGKRPQTWRAPTWYDILRRASQNENYHSCGFLTIQVLVIHRGSH